MFKVIGKIREMAQRWSRTLRTKWEYFKEERSILRNTVWRDDICKKYKIVPVRDICTGNIGFLKDGELVIRPSQYAIEVTEWNDCLYLFRGKSVACIHSTCFDGIIDTKCWYQEYLGDGVVVFVNPKNEYEVWDLTSMCQIGFRGITYLRRIPYTKYYCVGLGEDGYGIYDLSTWRGNPDPISYPLHRLKSPVEEASLQLNCSVKNDRDIPVCVYITEEAADVYEVPLIDLKHLENIEEFSYIAVKDDGTGELIKFSYEKGLKVELEIPGNTIEPLNLPNIEHYYKIIGTGKVYIAEIIGEKMNIITTYEATDIKLSKPYFCVEDAAYKMDVIAITTTVEKACPLKTAEN